MIAANRFMKRLMGIIHMCFKKIRIGTTKENSKTKELFEKRRNLKNKQDEQSKKELKDVENMLSDLCAEENMEKIQGRNKRNK